MKVTIKDPIALSSCKYEQIANYLQRTGWAFEENQKLFLADNLKISVPEDDMSPKIRAGKVGWILMILEDFENRNQLSIWCDITGESLVFEPSKNS